MNQGDGDAKEEEEEEEEEESLPFEPSEPWIESEDDTAMNVSQIAWPWSFKDSAMQDVEDPGMRVLLERQMGGAARDVRFEEEISFIESKLQQRASCGSTLTELGFQVKKVCALQSSELEGKFAESVRSLQAEVWDREGWREERSLQGMSAGRRFFWKAETRESRWVPPMPSLEGLDAERSDAAGTGEEEAPVRVGGFPTVMCWRTVSSGMVKAIKKGSKNVWEEVRREEALDDAELLEDLDHPALEKGGNQLVCPELHAALTLAARRAGQEVEGVEEIEEGAELSLLLGLAVLGEEER
eukprot:758707-Hanusia_phi.AAC.8